MNRADRQRIEDERRGPVRIVGLSDGRIQWPISAGPSGLSLVLFQGLASRDSTNVPPTVNLRYVAQGQHDETYVKAFAQR